MKMSSADNLIKNAHFWSNAFIRIFVSYFCFASENKRNLTENDFHNLNFSFGHVHRTACGLPLQIKFNIEEHLRYQALETPNQQL